MPWLWNSWEEYLSAVYPVAVDSGGGLWHAKKDTWFENVSRLCKAVNKLEDCTNSLKALGFTGKDHSRPPDDPKINQQARNLILEAVYAGEELLFFDKRSLHGSGSCLWISPSKIHFGTLEQIFNNSPHRF